MKQFCINDHDTLKFGRNSSGRCKECKRQSEKKNDDTLCRKQLHQMTPENTGVRVNSNYCKMCKADYERSKYTPVPRGNVCPFGHNKIQSPDGRWRCRQCWNDRRRQKRLDEEMRIPVDGMEAEFGPCPPKENTRTWKDRVIIERVIHGVHKPGRSLSTAEIAEIVPRFKVMNISFEEIARRCDVSYSSVSKWFAKYTGDKK